MEVSSLPDDFRCPISLELMTDPVILASGHTFDRSSIQRWLDSGNHTCPLSNIPLPPSPPLIPNHALRSLIFRSVPVSPSLLSPSSEYSADLSFLPRFAFPASVSDLAAVLRLAQRGSVDVRRAIADSGAVPVLLRHAGGSSGDAQELALRCLLHLSLDGDDARVGLVAEGAVDAVASALASGSALAATLLTSLAVVDVNKCTIGAHQTAIPGLVKLLERGARERREAATALYELCKLPENRHRVVHAGAVHSLAVLASEGSDRAVEVLALLAKCEQGRREMRKVDDLVNVLTSILRRNGSTRGVEHALVVLNWLCVDCEETARKAVEEMAPELCSLIIDSEHRSDSSNKKVKKNATVLISTLEKWQFVSLV